MNNQPASPDKLDELFNQFIRECQYTKRLRPATLNGYKASYVLFRKLSHVTINSLSTEAMTDFFSVMQTRTRIVGKGIEKTGVKDSTIATYARKLNIFFEWLIREKHIFENPIKNLPKYRPVYDDAKALRKEDIERIRTAIANYSTSLLQKKRDDAMVSTLTFCGIRKGELLGLSVTDINLERRIMTVHGETSKSKRTKTLPINMGLAMDLGDYLEQRKNYKTPQLFVSLNQDKGLSPDGLVHWVYRLRKLSGVRFHLHQFRHTFASNLAAKGIGAIQLLKLLGHTDLRMTQVYVRSVTSDDLRPVVNGLTFENLM
jgi:integrase/recombinase XerD